MKSVYRKRMFIAYCIIAAILLLLLFRVAWIQVVKSGEYSEKAIAQQTSDIPIQPRRGSILDSKGKELAATATSYSIWVRPDTLEEAYTDKQISDTSVKLAKYLDMDAGDVYEKLTSDSGLLVVKRYIEKKETDKIREMMVPGIEISEENRRFYPMGDFASTIIGSVNGEGVGRSGIEQEYNSVLSGVAGRWVKDTDLNGNTLSYGQKKYHGADDGLNVCLTVDEILQHYLEDVLDNWMDKVEPDSIWAVAMNPKTGDILALAKTPSYDPNKPDTPSKKKEKEAFKEMKAEDQSAYLSKMWRNPVVSDCYEPGSTFKLITASSVLDEGLATPETTFQCSGCIDVCGVKMHDWNRKAHGTITLAEAVAKSCNPSHVQMAQMLGVDRFYNHIELFGFKDKTGIDLPAEGSSIITPKANVGPVELANMGFGQGIAVTPMQLITAISAIGNDGVMMQPRIVRSLTDQDGKTVKKFPVEQRKKVIAPDTAQEMLRIMESQVAQHDGFLPEYRIGGKTGTAEKSKDGKYTNEVFASFVSMAPIDDPEIALLIVIDNPTKGLPYGSTNAMPMSAEFYEKALPYLHISPAKRNDENKDIPEFTYIPDITGMEFGEAASTLAQQNIEYEIVPALTEEEKEDDDFSFEVCDQYPKAGQKMSVNDKVYIYRE